MQGQKTFDEIRKQVSRRPRVQADGRPLHRRVRAAARRGVARRPRPGGGAHLPHLGDRQGLHHARARGRPLRRIAAGTTDNHNGRAARRARFVLARPSDVSRAMRHGRFRLQLRTAMSPAPISLTVRTERWPIAGTLHDQPRRQDRGRGRGRRTDRRPPSRAAANACPMRATARPSTASSPRSRRCGRARARPRPHGAATGDAGRRRAQRARLRVLGSRGQARRHARPMSSPASPRRSRSSPPTRSRSATPDDDGGGRAQGRRPRAAQGEARRRRRSGADRGGAARRAARRADRRRQRRLDAGRTSTENLAACADAGVTLIEQPLPAGDDAALADVPRGRLPVCADESVHDRASLAALVGTATTRSTSSSTRPAA